MKKFLIISFLASLNHLGFAAGTTGNTKATATLASSCQVSATNVNFGQLNLQATQSGVTSSSNMTLYCTKGSAYTINLAYGGIYGKGTQVSQSYVYVNYTNNVDGNGKPYTTYYYNEYDGTGKLIGTPRFVGTAAANVPGCTPAGYSCTVGSTPYAYGLLTGAAKGDTISYKITVPGNDSAIWNNGNSSYTNTGTGANQNFPIKATIQTGTHGSQYPAADTYMDTITATVTY